MAFESLNDDKLMDLLNCPKKLTNPQARNKRIDGRDQVNYRVISTDDSGNEFELYRRQNLREGMEDDFSCGISWLGPNGENITLKRYNGASHSHRNQIEKEQLSNICHIHIATEKYIKANKKPEGYASPTARYLTVTGALHCLVTDCNIVGIHTEPDIVNQIKLEFE